MLLFTILILTIKTSSFKLFFEPHVIVRLICIINYLHTTGKERFDSISMIKKADKTVD